MKRYRPIARKAALHKAAPLPYASYSTYLAKSRSACDVVLWSLTVFAFLPFAVARFLQHHCLCTPASAICQATYATSRLLPPPTPTPTPTTPDPTARLAAATCAHPLLHSPLLAHLLPPSILRLFLYRGCLTLTVYIASGLACILAAHLHARWYVRSGRALLIAASRILPCASMLLEQLLLREGAALSLLLQDTAVGDKAYLRMLMAALMFPLPSRLQLGVASTEAALSLLHCLLFAAPPLPPPRLLSFAVRTLAIGVVLPTALIAVYERTLQAQLSFGPHPPTHDAAASPPPAPPLVPIDTPPSAGTSKTPAGGKGGRGVYELPWHTGPAHRELLNSASHSLPLLGQQGRQPLAPAPAASSVDAVPGQGAPAAVASAVAASAAQVQVVQPEAAVPTAAIQLGRQAYAGSVSSSVLCVKIHHHAAYDLRFQLVPAIESHLLQKLTQAADPPAPAATTPAHPPHTLTPLGAARSEATPTLSDPPPSTHLAVLPPFQNPIARAPATVAAAPTPSTLAPPPRAAPQPPPAALYSPAPATTAPTPTTLTPLLPPTTSPLPLTTATPARTPPNALPYSPPAVVLSTSAARGCLQLLISVHRFQPAPPGTPPPPAPPGQHLLPPPATSDQDPTLAPASVRQLLHTLGAADATSTPITISGMPATGSLPHSTTLGPFQQVSSTPAASGHQPSTVCPGGNDRLLEPTNGAVAVLEAAHPLLMEPLCVEAGVDREQVVAVGLGAVSGAVPAGGLPVGMALEAFVCCWQGVRPLVLRQPIEGTYLEAVMAATAAADGAMAAMCCLTLPPKLDVAPLEVHLVATCPGKEALLLGTLPTMALPPPTAQELQAATPQLPTPDPAVHTGFLRLLGDVAVAWKLLQQGGPGTPPPPFLPTIVAYAASEGLPHLQAFLQQLLLGSFLLPPAAAAPLNALAAAATSGPPPPCAPPAASLPAACFGAAAATDAAAEADQAAPASRCMHATGEPHGSPGQQVALPTDPPHPPQPPAPTAAAATASSSTAAAAEVTEAEPTPCGTDRRQEPAEMQQVWWRQYGTQEEQYRAWWKQQGRVMDLAAALTVLVMWVMNAGKAAPAGAHAHAYCCHSVPFVVADVLAMGAPWLVLALGNEGIRQRREWMIAAQSVLRVANYLVVACCRVSFPKLYQEQWLLALWLPHVGIVIPVVHRVGWKQQILCSAALELARFIMHKSSSCSSCDMQGLGSCAMEALLHVVILPIAAGATSWAVDQRGRAAFRKTIVAASLDANKVKVD